MKTLINSICALVVCLALAGCSGRYWLSPFPTTYREGITRDLIKYPDEVKNLSIRAASESELECKVIHDEALQHRLEGILDDLVSEADVEPEGLTIAAVDCKGLNAYSFPAARKIYIMKDLIELTASDDELAFVVAHELSHHYERSGRFAVPQKSREELALRNKEFLEQRIADCKLGEEIEHKYRWKSDYQQCINGVRFSALSIARAESREVETHTDEYALDLMHEAGYRQEAAKSILTKMSGKDEFQPITAANWYLFSLSTHPRAKERLEDINRWSNFAYGIREAF